ncbi:hypothetical protein N665_0160s0028 [Sinapis alba]|nr:hypothetical protein N665_0160s0028 [Sinapis alba]
MNHYGGRNQYDHERGRRGSSRRRKGLKCYECEGVGHMWVDCPVAQRRKLKCPGCKGVGHTRRECPNSKKRNGVSLQSSDDSESEEDEKVMKNHVAFGARKEESSESSDSDVGTDDEEYHVLLNKWLRVKDQNLRLEDVAHKQNELLEELREELAAVNEKNESLEQENLDNILSMGQPTKVTCGLGYRGADSTKEVHQKGLSHFMQESTNMKARHEVLKNGCAVGKRKETDWCFSNCVRPNKKQHRRCCWFCGKVGHKKVECFTGEKSRTMAKKVFLAKSVLLDEIKENTSEEGCISVRSDLEVDQEASSTELEHGVVCGTKGNEIEVHQEVKQGDLQEGDSEITPRQ